MKFLAIVVVLAGQFWETKAPADWSEAELNALLTDSPWAQMVQAPGTGSAPLPVQVMIASAGPIEKAEAEWARRHREKKPGAPEDVLDEEYHAWLQENRAASIVVAIGTPNKGDALSDDRETRTMQEQSVMIVGRKKYKMTGYFPPTAADRYLRIAFPRAVSAADKKVTFELYVPGAGIPYRSAEFSVKEMILGGKLEI